MERKIFGWTGERVSPLGLGTWQFGTSGLASETQTIRVIRKAVELGINLIDTAESYGSESIVGKAMKGLNRDQVFLITKVSREHLAYRNLMNSCEQSLRRLKTSYIDCYLVHHPSSRVPISETMKAMEELYKAGKIRYLGVSNFPRQNIEEARRSLSDTDIAVDEARYNLLFREAEQELIPWLQGHRIPLVAYDPLGLGFLIGRREMRAEYSWHSLYDTVEKLSPLHETLRNIAVECGRTPPQVALNWVLSKNGVFPIFNTTRTSHLEENVESAGFSLNEGQVRRIDEVIRKLPRFTSTA